MAGKRRTLGDEHPSTLASIFNFAGLLWKQGNKAEALEMFRQELEVSRRVHGEDHPSTQMRLRNYSNLTKKYMFFFLALVSYVKAKIKEEII